MPISKSTALLMVIAYGLFVSYISLDLFAGGPLVFADKLRFVSIFLCLTIAVSRQADASLCLALLFTACADFCLLVSYRMMTGLLFFCAVQMFYCIRYFGARHNKIKLPCTVIIMSSLSLVLADIIFGLSQQLIPYIAVFYFTCLLLNVYGSSYNIRTKKKLPLLSQGNLSFLGMLLFLCCDINVGLYNLNVMNDTVAVPIIWVFYLNGQVLLALS